MTRRKIQRLARSDIANVSNDRDPPKRGEAFRRRLLIAVQRIKDSARSKSSRTVRHRLAGEHGRVLQRGADLIGSAPQRFATACVSTLKDKVSTFVREQARPFVVIHKFHRAGFELLKFIIQNQRYALRFGGEGGIRTPDRLAPMPHFECGAFDHSATSPVPKRRFPAGSRASSMRGRPPRQALTGLSGSGMPGSAIPWGTAQMISTRWNRRDLP